MKTEDLLREIVSLPVEKRAQLADAVLRSLNPLEAENEKKWGEVAKQRLADFRSGKVMAVPGQEVFDEIWKKFPR